MKLELGEVVLTAGVDGWVGNSDDSGRFWAVTAALTAHKMGEWGDVDAHDAKVNDRALKAGGRIISERTIDDQRVWIITEADRSATTVLFPDEY